ncbi:MAG TPA: universal stress protein [Dehalococcoidia bacterium]|nr:universal stress protein [Dehalococcoidia bacterium]
MKALFASVLLALDGSRMAATAIPAALEMSNRFHAPLVILRVVRPRELNDGHAGLGSPDLRREYDARRSQAEGYLETLKQGLEPLAPSVEVLVRDGDPASVILETARGLEAPLIVMTVRGRSSSRKRGGLGDVARSVLEKAPGPVLLVGDHAGYPLAGEALSGTIAAGNAT